MVAYALFAYTVVFAVGTMVDFRITFRRSKEARLGNRAIRMVEEVR